MANIARKVMIREEELMSENTTFAIMYKMLFFSIVVVFVALLFLNIYFRVKVFKYYKYLIQNRVDFSISHFFSQEKMESEVLSRYPEHRYEIEKFVGLIRRSITMASILIVVIILFGYLLLRFR